MAGTTGGEKNDSAAVTSSNGGVGNTATASVNVVAPPTISAPLGLSTIEVGGSTSLTFILTNPAANTVGLNGVAFSDALPAGLVDATPNGETGGCGGGTITATAGSSSISLTGGMLGTGGSSSCTFSVNVTGVALGEQDKRGPR